MTRFLQQYLIFSLCFLMSISIIAQDVEQERDIMFLQGQVVLSEDGKEVYLETQDCAYAGKYYFGGIANENTGDKKIDKKAKKDNKKAAKKLKKYIRKASKAPNGVMVNMEVKGMIGEVNGRNMISPLNVINPMKPPIKTGVSPTLDDYTQLCYEIYLKLQDVKQKCRFVSYADVQDPNDELITIRKFWDQNCREMSPRDLVLKKAEGMKIYNAASALTVANVASFALLAAKVDQINKEIEQKSAIEQIAAAAQLVNAIAIQVRLLADNTRMQRVIKESKAIFEGLEE